MRIDSDYEVVHGRWWWDHFWHRYHPAGTSIPDLCWCVLYAGQPAAFMAGVDTDSKAILCEWLTASRGVPARARHKAVEHLMRFGLYVAVGMGKNPIILDPPKGVEMMAARLGWKSKQIAMLWRADAGTR